MHAKGRCSRWTRLCTLRHRSVLYIFPHFSQRYDRVCAWYFWWRCRWERSWNRFWHSGHSYGFSEEWMRAWCVRLIFCTNFWPQISHWYFLLSLCIFRCIHMLPSFKLRVAKDCSLENVRHIYKVKNLPLPTVWALFPGILTNLTSMCLQMFFQACKQLELTLTLGAIVGNTQSMRSRLVCAH